MEKLRTRAMVAGIAMIVSGIAIQATPTAKLPGRTEKELEKMAPVQVGDYTFYERALSKKPLQSYDLDEETYKILQPFGIVGRSYESGGKAFDVLLVSSNKKESFHDNRVCFEATGWTLTDQSHASVNTSRGLIPLTLVKMRHDQFGTRTAAFLYKGPADRPLLPTLSTAVLVGGSAALLLGLAWILVPALFTSGSSRRKSGFWFAGVGLAMIGASLGLMRSSGAEEQRRLSTAGFYSLPQELTMAMLKEQLAGGTNLDSTFFRFIPSEDVPKGELLGFIKSYLEEAEKVSGGYF